MSIKTELFTKLAQQQQQEKDDNDISDAKKHKAEDQDDSKVAKNKATKQERSPVSPTFAGLMTTIQDQKQEENEKQDQLQSKIDSFLKIQQKKIATQIDKKISSVLSSPQSIKTSFKSKPIELTKAQKTVASPSINSKSTAIQGTGTTRNKISSSVPKSMNSGRYAPPAKTARDYTPSNARLFKEINACFSFQQEPVSSSNNNNNNTKQHTKLLNKKGVHKKSSTTAEKNQKVKNSSQKIYGNSDLNSLILNKLNKALKSINITKGQTIKNTGSVIKNASSNLSPKRSDIVAKNSYSKAKSNSAERLNLHSTKRSVNLYNNKDVSYFVKRFEAQQQQVNQTFVAKSNSSNNNTQISAAAYGSFPSTPTSNQYKNSSKVRVKNQENKAVVGYSQQPPHHTRKNKMHKVNASLQRGLMDDNGLSHSPKNKQLSNTTPLDSILRAINLQDDSSAFRGAAGRSHIDDDSHVIDLRLKHPVKGAKFVASPNYYSQKRVKGHEVNSTAPIIEFKPKKQSGGGGVGDGSSGNPQIFDFYSVRPTNMRIQQQLQKVISNETSHRIKKNSGAKRAKKQPGQLKKDSSSDIIGGQQQQQQTQHYDERNIMVIKNQDSSSSRKITKTTANQQDDDANNTF